MSEAILRRKRCTWITLLLGAFLLTPPAGAQRPTDALRRLMAIGWQEQESGQALKAQAAFRQVAASGDSWYSWAGESALVASYRLAEDWEGARKATARIAVRYPDHRALMSLWDGDTDALAGDLDRAVEHYREAESLAAGALVSGDPLGAIALRQLARAELARGDAFAAALAERQILQSYPAARTPEYTLAKALAYEAMAAGSLPLVPLATLLHDGRCSAKEPCVIGTTDNHRSGRLLASLQGFSFFLSASDEAVLEVAKNATNYSVRSNRIEGRILACAPSAASDGFGITLSNTSPGGYLFMDTIPEGRHPGLDINTAAGDGDCGVSFRSVAQGCVTDSSPANWGSATVQHLYTGRTWTSQYGHAASIAFSNGAAITRGAILGTVGKVGASSCHLHHEIREEDHPAATNADYYSSLTQANVGDWYQNPFPFCLAHRSYSSAPIWVDEEGFSRTGTWTLQAGVGDEDDMRWGATTATGTKSTYATYTFTPSTTGTYEVWAFVPWNYGTSTAALYKVARTGGATVFSKSVNQLPLLDQWVLIGSGSLTGGLSYYIEVATNNGESGKKVAIDDFLIFKP